MALSYHCCAICAAITTVAVQEWRYYGIGGSGQIAGPAPAQTPSQALLYILTVIFATMWGARENALTWFNQAGAFLCTVTFLFQREA